MSVPSVKRFKLKCQMPRFCLQTTPACSRSTPGRAALTWWNGITNPRPTPALSSGLEVARATVISLTLRASAGNPASWTKRQSRCETKHGYKPKSNRFYLLKPGSGALTKTLTGANTGPYLSNLSQKRLHRKRKNVCVAYACVYIYRQIDLIAWTSTLSHITGHELLQFRNQA